MTERLTDHEIQRDMTLKLHSDFVVLHDKRTEPFFLPCGVNQAVCDLVMKLLVKEDHSSVSVTEIPDEF